MKLLPSLFFDCSGSRRPYAQERPMKAILDTDIGDDIDDAWALAFVIAHMNFDPLGSTVAHGNTPARGKMACKTLHLTGRGSRPVFVRRQTSRRDPAANSHRLKISPLDDLTRKSCRFHRGDCKKSSR